MEELSSGRVSSIFRDGDVVYRPLQPWSSTIHRLLAHLKESGIYEVPQFLGIDDDQEKLSFVSGETFNYPLTGAIATQDALISAAKFLRELHDSTATFVSKIEPDRLPWMLEPREPFEVICHGDFTPYNVALNGNVVSGVFDFDTAHPAPRIWDLAFSIYCWSPFKTNSVDRLGTIEDQTSRARTFCDSYGASLDHREQLADYMVIRLNALARFMREEADNGNEQFSENIEHGHLQSYLDDIKYIIDNKQKIQSALCN